MSLNYNWMYRRARAPRATRASHAQQTPVKRHEQTQKRIVTYVCVCTLAWLVAGAAVGDAGAAGAAGAGGGWRVDADMSRARGVRRATGDARGVARVPSSIQCKCASAMQHNVSTDWLALPHPQRFDWTKGFCVSLGTLVIRAVLHWGVVASLCDLRLHRLQQYVLGAST